MSTLCSICLHLDEQMEYSRGGAVIVPICMYNYPNFGLVKRPEQCRFFSNMNQQEADDADSDSNFDVVRGHDRPTDYGDNHAG